MKLLKILKDKYLGLFIFLTLAVLVLYPLFQISITPGANINFWLAIIPKINLVLVFVFSLMFGLLVALQVYNFQDKTCPTGKKATSTTSGGLGTILAILVPACPACLSFVTFLVPAALALSVGSFFVKFGTLLLVLSILLMFLGIFLLGGFKKSEKSEKFKKFEIIMINFINNKIIEFKSILIKKF